MVFTDIFLCWTPPVRQEWRPKSEIRNPKSETNSNKQRSNASKPSRRRRADWSRFENLSFEFGACFGFRVSDFGFVRLVFTHIFLCWTPLVRQEWRPKSEIRNPKSETNSNKQRSNASKPSRRR